MHSLSNILNSNRSQSEVVATVLLILLVIVAVTIITTFAVPFVRDQLSKSDCLSVTGEDKLGITDSIEYTCYNSSKPEMLVQIHVGDIYDKINGFSIEIGGATTNTYDITKDSAPAGVTPYGPGGVEVPAGNTERTYRIDLTGQGDPKTLKVYPILTNGENCDYSDSLTSIPACFVA